MLIILKVTFKNIYNTLVTCKFYSRIGATLSGWGNLRITDEVSNTSNFNLRTKKPFQILDDFPMSFWKIAKDSLPPLACTHQVYGEKESFDWPENFLKMSHTCKELFFIQQVVRKCHNFFSLLGLWIGGISLLWHHQQTEHILAVVVILKKYSEKILCPCSFSKKNGRISKR